LARDHGWRHVAPGHAICCGGQGMPSSPGFVGLNGPTFTHRHCGDCAHVEQSLLRCSGSLFFGERRSAGAALILSLWETLSPGFVGLSGRRVTFLCFAKEK
jgi:hypothetical protein